MKADAPALVEKKSEAKIETAAPGEVKNEKPAPVEVKAEAPALAEKKSEIKIEAKASAPALP